MKEGIVSLASMLNKNVIKVTAEGDEKPYSAYGKYYMRSADEDREISPQQLRNLMLSISDSIVNIEASSQELSFDQLKTLYVGKNLTLRENAFKQNLNFLTRDGNYNLMAAILADIAYIFGSSLMRLYGVLCVRNSIPI